MRRFAIGLVFTVACAEDGLSLLPPPPRPGDPPETTVPEDTIVVTTPPTSALGPCAADPICTDLELVPLHWQLEEGWRTGFPLADLGDIDGDGHADFACSMFGPQGEFELDIVAGPITAPRLLPADARARIADAMFAAAGDATGDGVTDLFVARAGETALVAGPLAGAVQLPEGALAAYPTRMRWSDLDGDGALEMIDDAYEGGIAYVYRGTYDQWVGEPSITFQSSDPYARLLPVEGVPDQDGDGISEIRVGWNWVVPADVSGTVDLDVADHYTVSTPVGDNDGDGDGDVFFGGTIYASPVVFNPYGALVGPVIASRTEEWALAGWGAAGFDLDGDGTSEIWGYLVDILGSGGDRLLFTGGDGGGFASGVPSRRFRSSAAASGEESPVASLVVRDEGHEYLVVHGMHGVGVVDLGAADSVP